MVRAFLRQWEEVSDPGGRFLSDTPEDRYWAITHLLGTQDFTRLTDKLGKMDKELEKKVETQRLLEAEFDKTFNLSLVKTPF